MKTLAALTAAVFFMAGCTSKKSVGTPDNINDVPEKGIAIGTITFEGDVPYNDIYRFFYEPVSGSKKFIRHNKGKIEIKARVKNDPAYNGDFNNKKTYLFVIQQEPGEYALTQYNYLDHIGYTGTVYNSEKFSLPFEIKKGQTNYIGELTYVENVKPGSPRIYIWDKYERDLEEFRKKYPDYNWSNSTDNTIKKGNDGGGIIEFMAE